ncbi:MAG: Mur ligase domain-containing protein, partial [Patescibacteria group bacterium]|nr:Mur ligase domain-containing protein [Patescibacteria group bacterium]
MQIEKAKNIYMIGIKGVGMTMLAQFLARQGKTVSGSDTTEKFMTDKVLKKERIKVIEEFAVSNIPAQADVIIYSTAYNKRINIEVDAAFKSGKKIMAYAEALGEIFNYKYGIGVIGTHGKTTTAAWLGYVLDKAGKQPNVMVGAQVPQFNGNILFGYSDYLVA